MPGQGLDSRVGRHTCCTALPPGLTATLMVVPGEFTDAERYGALAAADAHAVALVSEGPARERVLRG